MEMKVFGLMLLVMVVVVATAVMAIAAEDEDAAATVLELRSQVGGYNVRGSDLPWECCDRCTCNPSVPPQCICTDINHFPCSPNCKNCVRLAEFIYPPLILCMDVVTGGCGDPCSPETLKN